MDTNREEVDDVLSTLQLAIANAKTSSNAFFLWCDGNAFTPKIMQDIRQAIENHGVKEQVRTGKATELESMIQDIRSQQSFSSEECRLG